MKRSMEPRRSDRCAGRPRPDAAGAPSGACRLPLALLLALIAGCAGSPPALERAQSVELTAVPFFPQTQYQCGPAALATLLADAGLPVDADTLTPEVYVEGLRGSLQAELLAATRRHGLIPYPIDGDLGALLAEIDAGRPVLVLQNLGLARLPVWHYAVVVGFDANRARLVLRSGTEKRRLERPRRFMRSWQRAERWGFVAVPPGQLPARATPRRYIRALADTEAWLDAGAVEAAHAVAVEAWPAEPLVLFAAATQHFSAGRLAQAEQSYRRLLAKEPSHVAARNNLAHVLADQGRCTAALEQARQALALAAASQPALASAVSDTLAELRSAAASNRECR